MTQTINDIANKLPYIDIVNTKVLKYLIKVVGL